MMSDIPVRTLQGSRKKLRKRKGFSFIEVMVVIVILGLLAGIVGVNMLSSVDQAKVDVTKTRIESLRAALDLYRLHNNRYPSTEQGLISLKTKPDSGKIPKSWNGPYMRKLPTDGWDNEFKYTSEGSTFEIKSLGADDAEGGDENDADISSNDG